MQQSLFLRTDTEVVVSGRYEGSSVFPASGSYYLDLRVDVDKRYDYSPIMNRDKWRRLQNAEYEGYGIQVMTHEQTRIFTLSRG